MNLILGGKKLCKSSRCNKRKGGNEESFQSLMGGASIKKKVTKKKVAKKVAKKGGFEYSKWDFETIAPGSSWTDQPSTASTISGTAGPEIVHNADGTVKGGKNNKSRKSKGGNCDTQASYPWGDVTVDNNEKFYSGIFGGSSNKSRKSKKGGDEGGYDGGAKSRKAKKGGNHDKEEFDDMYGGAKSRKAKKGGNNDDQKEYDYQEMNGGAKSRKAKKGGIVELTPFISALALFGARMYNESRNVAKKSKLSRK